MSRLPSSSNEITYENFLTICRCCIMNRGEIDVFEAHMEDLPLSNIIFLCTNEMIDKNDGFSRIICRICMQILINSYSFIQTFKESQQNLKNMHEVFASRNFIHENGILPAEKLFIKEDYMGDYEIIDNSFEEVNTNLVQSKIQLHAGNRNCSDEKGHSKIGECSRCSSMFSEAKIRNTVSEAEKPSNKDPCLDDSAELNSCDISDVEAEDTLRKKRGRKPNRRIEVDPMLRSGLDLQCFQCLSVFPSKAEMVRHHKATNHTIAPNYKCGVCSKAISRRKAYWDHMAMHRHLKKKAVCEVCGAVVVSLHLKRHMLVHQEKTHMCQYCGRGYVQKNTLTEHVKRKHEGGERNMNTLCFICGKICNDLKSLTTHLNTHTNENLKGLSHRCVDCGKYFLNEQSLSTHVYMAHKISERMPKQHKRSKNKQKPKMSKEIRKTNAPKYKKGNVDPKKNIPKREPRECTICHKMICYLGFNRHLTTHTGVKPHQCKHCSKSFRLFSSLKSHMYVHLDLKPFKCDICNQQFRHYTTLKVHKRVHTGEKPYNCHVCSKGFRSASGLKRHQNQRQHHKTELEENKDELNLLKND